MAIFDELKSIGKILQEAGKIEQYQQILDTLQKLLEMQKKISELEAENKKIKEEFEIRDTIISDRNLYWTEKNGIKDGPFCTCCWDSERKLMRLHEHPNSGKIYCPKCNTSAVFGRAQIFNPINHRRNSAL